MSVWPQGASRQRGSDPPRNHESHWSVKGKSSSQSMELLSKPEKQTETGYVCNNWLSCLCLPSIVHARDAESSSLLSMFRVLASHRREAGWKCPLLCLGWGKNSKQEAEVFEEPRSALSLMVLAICHRNRKRMATRSLRGDWGSLRSWGCSPVMRFGGLLRIIFQNWGNSSVGKPEFRSQGPR